MRYKIPSAWKQAFASINSRCERPRAFWQRRPKWACHLSRWWPSHPKWWSNRPRWLLRSPAFWRKRPKWCFRTPKWWKEEIRLPVKLWIAWWYFGAVILYWWHYRKVFTRNIHVYIEEIRGSYWRAYVVMWRDILLVSTYLYLYYVVYTLLIFGLLYTIRQRIRQWWQQLLCLWMLHVVVFISLSLTSKAVRYYPPSPRWTDTTLFHQMYRAERYLVQDGQKSRRYFPELFTTVDDVRRYKIILNTAYMRTIDVYGWFGLFHGISYPIYHPITKLAF